MATSGDDNRTANPMGARQLVIDCATPALSIALFDGETCLDACHRELGRGHAEALMPAIAALPDGGRADHIFVDVGPGSFTGVRVGVAAARALGFAWGVPVHGFGCLDLVAAMVRARAAPADPFPVVMIGGHGELFWAICPPAGDPHAAEPLAVTSTTIAQLTQQLDQTTVYGSGAQTLIAARAADRRPGGEAIPLLPDARCIGLLSQAQTNLPPRPVYGRGADAKPMAAARALPLPARSIG